MLENSLFGLNAVLPFILETEQFLEKYWRFLIRYRTLFFVSLSKTVLSEIYMVKIAKMAVYIYGWTVAI